MEWKVWNWGNDYNKRTEELPKDEGRAHFDIIEGGEGRGGGGSWEGSLERLGRVIVEVGFRPQNLTFGSYMLFYPSHAHLRHTDAEPETKEQKMYTARNKVEGKQEFAGRPRWINWLIRLDCGRSVVGSVHIASICNGDIFFFFALLNHGAFFFLFFLQSLALLGCHLFGSFSFTYITWTFVSNTCLFFAFTFRLPFALWRAFLATLFEF